MQVCAIAPSLFLPPMDWVLERTEHKGFLGATLGDEVFTDLNFADDVSLLAETLDVLLLALGIMNQEAQHFGLDKKTGTKSKIQTIMDPPQYLAPSIVAGNMSRLLINSPISAARLTALVQVRQMCSDGLLSCGIV